jgi:transcriptional regulator with XRE-family HTH domain
MGDKKRTPTEAFGQVLQELRARKGLTQEALALEAGTERSHISALERAEKGPSLGTILSLARALDISAGEIMSMVEDKVEQTRRQGKR